MNNQSGFDYKIVQSDRNATPCKGWPVRLYTYKGAQPWTPKTSRS